MVVAYVHMYMLLLPICRTCQRLILRFHGKAFQLPINQAQCFGQKRWFRVNISYIHIYTCPIRQMSHEQVCACGTSTLTMFSVQFSSVQTPCLAKSVYFRRQQVGQYANCWLLLWAKSNTHTHTYQLHWGYIFEVVCLLFSPCSEFERLVCLFIWRSYRSRVSQSQRPFPYWQQTIDFILCDIFTF